MYDWNHVWDLYRLKRLWNNCWHQVIQSRGLIILFSRLLRIFEFSTLKVRTCMSGPRSHPRHAEPVSQWWGLESEFWELPSDSDGLVCGLVFGKQLFDMWTGVWGTVVWQDISIQPVYGRTQVAWLQSRILFRIIGSLLNANALAPQSLPLLGNRMLWPSLNACGQKAPQELSKTFQHFVIISRNYQIHKDLCVFMKKERDFWATFCTGTHI